MATSKINNPHVPGSVLAESTGTKTYAEHISAILSAFRALDTSHKMRCAIVIDENRVYRVMDAKTNPAFTRITGGTPKLYIGQIYVTNNGVQLLTWELSTSGITLTDASSDSINTTVKLVYGI